jgi:ABC-type uncharacterized transport system substrate-binding protein
LMAYSANNPALFRRAATFIDKLLKGAKPADLPVSSPRNSNCSSTSRRPMRSA